jgi:DNA-binding transcriptional ArsR family regulator
MDLDDTLIALADDTRRTILKRLASGEARVTEVAAPFGISLNSVRSTSGSSRERAWCAGASPGATISSPSTPAFRRAHALDARDARILELRLDHLEAALRADDAIAAAQKSSTPKPKPEGA